MDNRDDVSTMKGFWGIYRKNPSFALRLIREYVKSRSVGHIELVIQHQEELSNRGSKFATRFWLAVGVFLIIASIGMQISQVKAPYLLTAWSVTMVVFLVAFGRWYDTMLSWNHSVYAYFLRDAQKKYQDRVIIEDEDEDGGSSPAPVEKPDAGLF